jgi:hypothetical protein
MPYSLRIRDKPIQEEEDEAQKVMNDMANQLRAVGLFLPFPYLLCSPPPSKP